VRLLTRASARYLGHHRAQLVLSVVGVALGVAVVLAIDLATQSARAGFRVSAETVSGRATHRITSETALIDESLLSRLRTELGVRASAPVLEGYASSPLLPGQALRILGVDPFSEGPFRPFVAGGTAGFAADGAAGVDVGGFVTTRGGVVLSSPTAARAGVAPGDSLPVLVGGVAWRLPVIGTLDPADRLTRSGLSDVLLMDISGAQEVLDAVGGLTHIDLALPETAETDEQLRRISAILPAGVSVGAAGTRTDAMAGMIDAFDVNLTALSLLALIFGMFLIYNAVTFSVVQRRDLLGRLRTIGVTRAEILRLILREAAWIGLAGATIGLGVGVVLARGLVRLVTRTINDLYFTVSVEGVALDPMVVAKAAALGLGATLLAALPPALEAAAAQPRLTMLRSISEEQARRMVPRGAAAGLALGALGWAMLELSTRSLAVSFGALALVVSGLALLTPAGAVLLLRLVRPLLGRVGGTVGLIASRGVVASLSRTAPAVAALVVAVSVTVGLGVMIQSFRGSLERWLDGTLRADIYVSLPGPTASRATGTLWPGLVEAFVAHPDVVAHSKYRALDLLEDRGGYRLVALELHPRGEGAFDFLSGDAEAIMRAFQADQGVIVSEPFAFRRALEVGDAVALPAPRGDRPLPILGVFRDYGSDQGAVMMSRSLYDRLFDDEGVTSLALFLAAGADSEDVVSDLLALVPDGRAVIARTNDTLRSASLEVFDRTFEVTAVLRMLAFIVAFVGVLSALMALELERSRELGVMRAWGLTPGELWKLVVTQTGLMGLVSGILAVPMGLVLSIVMIFVVNKRSFGWTLDMQVGPEVLAQAVGLALVGALLAGLYPAWRMSRTSPALALRGE
jgi:putative ABC transport system permease protein